MQLIDEKQNDYLAKTGLVDSLIKINLKQRNAPIMAAILGDIVGSPFEFNPIKTKEFALIDDRSQITDDTSMIIAIKRAIDEGVSFEESLYGFGVDFPT